MDSANNQFSDAKILTPDTELQQKQDQNVVAKSSYVNSHDDLTN